MKKDCLLKVPPLDQSAAEFNRQFICKLLNQGQITTLNQLFTEGATWRNNQETFVGKVKIQENLALRRQRLLHYRLGSSVRSFSKNSINLQITSEWQHSSSGQWYRSTGELILNFDVNGSIQNAKSHSHDKKISADKRELFESPLAARSYDNATSTPTPIYS